MTKTLRPSPYGEGLKCFNRILHFERKMQEEHLFGFWNKRSVTIISVI